MHGKTVQKSGVVFKGNIMRAIGVLLVLAGLGAIGIKLLGAYAHIDVMPYFGMVADFSRSMFAKYGDYWDYGVRGAMVILGIIIILLTPGDED